jgi:ribosomal protein L28
MSACKLRGLDRLRPAQCELPPVVENHCVESRSRSRRVIPPNLHNVKKRVKHRDKSTGKARLRKDSR